jgi:hypothetical protein
MKVVSVRGFRDRASENVPRRRRDPRHPRRRPSRLLPALGHARAAVEVRREVFLRLSEQIGAQLDQQGTSEQVVLDNFAASRRRR